jgi:hypothetical protein
MNRWSRHLEVALELAVVPVVPLEQEEPGLVQEWVERLALVPMFAVRNL